ncbi:MAG: ATP-binding protein, partial [Bacteroidota bacterium]
GIVWEAEAPPLRFTIVSKKAERLRGYPAEAWSEDPDFWRNHIHPDDRDWVTDYCAESSRLRESHQFEYRMIAADGRIIWLRDMVVVSATGDDSIKLQGIMVDITERKQAEGELERLKRQHELILNSAGEGIFGIDSEGRALFANPAAAKMLGFSVEELLHQFLHPLIHHTRADGTPFPLEECPNRLIMKDGRTRFVEHDLFWRKDGTSFPVERVVAAIRIDDRIIGTVNIFQDITEREREQQQRQQFEALKQVDALKDQFLSILSHELRTPINSITGFGSLLQDEVAGPLNETQAHYLERMLNGAETLLSLVNDLLDMSRIQAGKFTLSPHSFDFSQLVEEVLKDLSPLSGEKQQHLENAVPSALILIADEQRIRQVLVNLLGNAIKFTPEGGTIAVRAHIEENDLVFEVEDNGLGIAPEDLPKLFRPFTQIDMTVTRQATGTGLGLSIAKALVEAHGGSISVSSPGLGRGATFSVRIPGAKKGEAR